MNKLQHPTVFTVSCRDCGHTSKGLKISEAMDADRFHREQRHIQAKIETDT